MSQNDDLAAIRDSLTEASTEIPARLDELLAQVAAGQPADSALVDQVKGLATGLANIVPGSAAPVEPSPENPAPVQPAPVETPETPEPEPVDPAAEPEKPLETEAEPVDPETSSGSQPPVDHAAGTPAETVAAADATVSDAAGRLPG